MIQRSTTKHVVILLFSSCLFVWLNAATGQTLTEISRGEHEDLHFNFWKDSGNASMTLLEGGRYQSQWDKDTNNWIGGLGWSVGGPRVVHYQGTYTPDDDANSYLALYGWSTNPLIEYYVLESFGTWNPASSGTYYGTYKSDGVTYDAYYSWLPGAGINAQPRITYFSIRRDKHAFGEVSGSITTSHHFNAWQQMGLTLSDLDYMIMATEGYQSSGSSDIQVSEGEAGCGHQDGMPICCIANADRQDDKYGQLFTSETCIITENTLGWHPPNPDTVVAAVNVGKLYESVLMDGIWYEANRYVGGAVLRATQDPIAGTDSAVYQTAGIGDISIEIPITSTEYVSVQLGFVELMYDDDETSREFNVSIEGETVLTNVNVFAQAGYKTLWEPAPSFIDVSDGILNIELTSTNNDAILSSILVTMAEPSNASSASSSNVSSASSSSNSQTTGGNLDLWFYILMIWLTLRLGRRLSFPHKKTQLWIYL